MTERTIIEQAADVIYGSEDEPNMYYRADALELARALAEAGLLRDPVKEADEPIMVQLLCLLDPTGEHSMAELKRRLAIAERALECEPDGFSGGVVGPSVPRGSTRWFVTPAELHEWIVGSGVSTTGAET